MAQSDSFENYSPVREAQVRLLYPPPSLVGASYGGRSPQEDREGEIKFMTITICGSMQFHKEMAEAKKTLEAAGFTVLVPADLDHLEKNESYMTNDEDKISTKIEFDFIREHFRKIEDGDAILILNYPKKALMDTSGAIRF